MDRTLIVATFDRWLVSPPRIALVAVFAAMAILPSFIGSGGGRVGTGSTAVLVMILGAGIVGRDVAGVLQVLFTRPIRRSEYVISRWVGLGIAGAVIASAEILLAGIGALHGGGMTPAAWALQFPEHVFTAFGVAAVFVLFSSLLNGFGDLGLYVAFSFIGYFLDTVGGMVGSRTLRGVAAEMVGFLTPDPDLHAILAGDPNWFRVVSYFSTVTLALALAVAAVNRKEISYAAD